MKQILIFVCLIVLFAFAGMRSASKVAQPNQPEALSTTIDDESINPLPKLVTANNDFGFRIFHQLTKDLEKENVFISPTSIALALSMTYNGAAGKTQAAMAKTLGFEFLTLNQVNEANLSLSEKLKSIDPKITLNIANSLWGHQGIKFKTDFINQNKKYYSAEVTTLDFSNPKSPQRINKWVSEKTNKKITKIINFLSPPQLLVLVNAIYFKGKWSQEFDKKKTQELPFTLLNQNQKKVPMMTQSGKYHYFEDKDLQAIKLLYGDGKMSMFIFEPQSNLFDFLKNLNQETWSKYLSQFKYQKGNITLPRFKFEYGKTLNDALINLGMENTFADADFSKMCDLPAFIGAVLHKTFVEVNEHGTEAAAVTAVIVTTSIAKEPEPFNMIVDHPFFFAICDDETNAILFMGAVTEPK